MNPSKDTIDEMIHSSTHIIRSDSPILDTQKNIHNQNASPPRAEQTAG